MLILVLEGNEQDQVHTYKCIIDYFYLHPAVKIYHFEYTFHDSCKDLFFQIFCASLMRISNIFNI